MISSWHSGIKHVAWSPPPLPTLNGVDGIEPLDALRALFETGARVVASDPASVALSKNNSSSSMFALQTSSTQTLAAGSGKKMMASTSTGW